MVYTNKIFVYLNQTYMASSMTNMTRMQTATPAAMCAVRICCCVDGTEKTNGAKNMKNTSPRLRSNGGKHEKYAFT